MRGFRYHTIRFYVHNKLIYNQNSNFSLNIFHRKRVYMNDLIRVSYLPIAGNGEIWGM